MVAMSFPDGRNTLVVITEAGDVWGVDVVGDSLYGTSTYEFFGPKLDLTNPSDRSRFMVAMGNTIIVITRKGNVFGFELDPTLGVQSVARVFGFNVVRVFRFNGGAPQKIGFNAQDKFMVGDVFGADV